ncbi:MAG TPA: YdeI/OmpD-associated family protein [Lysobacter sp.]
MAAASPKGLPNDLPIRLFDTAADWEKWVLANGGASGLWLKIAKKGQGVVSVTYAEALDVALCHGWIDGLKRACDEQYFLQRFTPRRAGSLWSKINVGKVERLIAEGRMQAGGLREVEAARADGRWQAAYHAASGMEVPPELAAALAKDARARKFFEQLDGTNRYAFCWRVHTAKKPETRLARAAKFVEMLARGEKIHG